MSTVTDSPAKRFYDTMTALRAQKITVDQARAANKALREELGDDAYQQAKFDAMASASR